MEFGSTITNPLLQIAVTAGEATIRHACGSPAGLNLESNTVQFADGRDAIQVTLRAPDAVATFTMLLRNYFDRAVLWRVARRAWNHRLQGQPPLERTLLFPAAALIPAMN
jgi:hypothetical protein